MSLQNRMMNGETFEIVDPGYISEPAMEQLCTIILAENLNPEETETAISEGVGYDIVTEKNIVKLDKHAKLNRAYKTAILQCAAEDKVKEYGKLRKLWKIEAGYFRKLEKRYKNKAMARAKEAVKKMNRSNNKTVAVAGERAAKNLGGTNKLLNSKPITLSSKK